MDRAWIVSTGLNPDGSHNPRQAQIQLDKWRLILDQTQATSSVSNGQPLAMTAPIRSSMSRAGYVQAVQRAQQFIRNGDIYQVNLTHRLATPQRVDPSNFFTRLSHLSPAPYSAIFDFPERALVSSSPELFLRMSGRQITSRPIKGTRPRSSDPLRDAQWMYELQTSEKETAELVMITDLLRNDLGRISEYGSVQVPDLLRLERFRQVQHLVSTVEGRLRPELDHLQALAACFPGGSITGAPKLRAMQIIHELEPVFRGPYCGAIGYLGFNRESQLSIAIRTAQLDSEGVAFHVGAGIVADSDPEAEYAETLAKARGFLDMWQWPEKQVQGSEPFQITHHP
jgi:para-aminobenzoate synthetase component 1